MEIGIYTFAERTPDASVYGVRDTFNSGITILNVGGTVLTASFIGFMRSSFVSTPKPARNRH